MDAMPSKIMFELTNSVPVTLDWCTGLKCKVVVKHEGKTYTLTHYEHFHFEDDWIGTWELFVSDDDDERKSAHVYMRNSLPVLDADISQFSFNGSPLHTLQEWSEVTTNRERIEVSIYWPEEFLPYLKKNCLYDAEKK